MTRPTVHAATEEVWAELGSPLTRDQDDNGWALLLLLDAAGRLAGVIYDLVTNDWAALLDASAADVDFLRWLAQPAGVTLDDRLSVAQQRQQILDRPATRAGTPQAVVLAARPHLNSGDVTINERHLANPHRAEIVYTAAQVDSALTYAQLAAAYPTYDDVADQFRRYSDFNGSEDELQAAVLRAVPAEIVVTFTKT